jgi:hypothetical protein
MIIIFNPNVIYFFNVLNIFRFKICYYIYKFGLYKFNFMILIFFLFHELEILY